MRFLIQGSSRSWSGDIEHCMYYLDDKPAIYWTIKRVYDNFDNAIVQLIAPEYDKGGELELLKNDFDKLEIFYGFDESPLNRMVEATINLDDNEHFARINALNFQFDIDFIKEMYKSAEENSYDCIKLEDDYPVHFVGEVYKVSAVRKIKKILQGGDIENSKYHEVHPKFLLMRLYEFNSNYYIPNKSITKKEVDKYIEKMKSMKFLERLNIVENKQILSGDQLTFHYELAEKFIFDKNFVEAKLLDIACGTGYGTIRFSDKGFIVHGADYDENQINENKKRFKNSHNVIFQKEDIMKLSYEDNSFDIILSMETIEHVDPDKTLKELKRVLKKGGYLILSTPQNSTTEQCINPVHLYEYSLKEIKSIVSNYFQIETIIGLKAGRIYFEDDPIGANTMIFAKKI